MRSKEEIIRDIERNYNVHCVFDDYNFRQIYMFMENYTGRKKYNILNCCNNWQLDIEENYIFQMEELKLVIEFMEVLENE